MKTTNELVLHDSRRELGKSLDFQVAMYWEEASGEVFSVQPRALERSARGMQLIGPIAVTPGTHVYLDVSDYGTPQEAVVRFCIPDESGHRITVEFTQADEAKAEAGVPEIDYYEVLQLSENADSETIHRVFRIMAARFHPDNPESGDEEKFLRLTEAYEVLGNAEHRARYDAGRKAEEPTPVPLFQTKAFVDDREGENNRRLGVLCLLYAHRRRDTEHPSVGLLKLEEMMSIPREYLEFTLWYLKQKRYVEITDASDFSLTAEGVDFVEEHAPAQSMLVSLRQLPAKSARPVPYAVKPN